MRRYGAATTTKRAKATVFVLPNGVALAAGWVGDNSGPPPVATAQEDFTSLRALFPNATIKASTFDAFFAVANEPAVKQLLPVVTVGSSLHPGHTMHAVMLRISMLRTPMPRTRLLWCGGVLRAPLPRTLLQSLRPRLLWCVACAFAAYLAAIIAASAAFN